MGRGAAGLRTARTAGPPRTGASMGYPAGRSLRLRKRAEIRRVFAEGRRTADARLTLWGLPAGNEPGGGVLPDARRGGEARIGVAASKAHGTAVRRNRAKRLCREAARLLRAELPGGWDFILIPRAGADLTLAALQDSLRRLARRLAEARP